MTSSKKLLRVHTRVYASDVQEVKRSAKAQGLPWQVELRLLIHRAIKEKTIAVIK